MKPLEVPKCYFNGNQTNAFLQARLRNNCYNLNDDLYEYQISSSQACSCSKNKETAYFYYLECQN